MIVERTFDADLIKHISTLPEMWATIAEDGIDPNEYQPEMEKNCYLLASEGKEIIGAFSLKRINAITLDVHPLILPWHRGKNGKEAGFLHLKWIYENHPEFKKLTALIPTIYRHVKLYALMLGYVQEGLSRASFMKNGQIHDQWLMGITRDEIGEVLEWT